MLKNIGCPSYKITQHDGEDVAMVPYVQFHTFMTEVLTNNREVQRANELFDHWRETLILCSKHNKEERLMDLYNSTLQYLGDVNVIEGERE